MNQEETSKTLHGFISLFPKYPVEGMSYWTKADLILCATEAECTWLATLMDKLFDISTSTGYFDPFEDADSGQTDEFTGWHYIEL